MRQPGQAAAWVVLFLLGLFVGLVGAASIGFVVGAGVEGYEFARWLIP